MRANYFKVLNVFLANKFFLVFKSLFCELKDFCIVLDDVFNFWDDHFADIIVSVTLVLAEFLNHLDNSVEQVRPVLFDMAHKIFELFFFRACHHKLIAFFKKPVELASETVVREKSIAYFDIAVMFIISSFILP